MTEANVEADDATLHAIGADIVGASDRQIKRIVAMVDAMTARGAADALIVPLRRQQRTLRMPRPLRFKRLLFAPLDPLIVPTEHWRLGHNTIPRTALTPMADHVRQAMGREAQSISTAIADKTTSDSNLITRLGRPLWPTAAQILAEADIPETWRSTGLGDAVYRKLASIIAAVLDQAATLEILCAEAADRLLPPRPEPIARMVSKTASSSPTALPMLIALILLRLPQAMASIRGECRGKEAPAIRDALDQAADQLLRQLADDKATDARIVAGTLADASGACRRIITLLDQLRADSGKPQRREQIRAVRQRLDASCRKRFSAGMQNEFLLPLQHLGDPPALMEIKALEDAARGLRMLDIEARTVGSAVTYDLLLSKATEAVKADAMGAKLTIVDQIRLVEILSGPDAALAMLDQAD